MYKKLKSLIADELVFTTILLCCVGVSAFFLGRASVESRVDTVDTASTKVQLIRTEAAPMGALMLGGTSSVTTPPATSAASIVASKSGTKYHLVTCPGAKQIKEENKVYFASSAEAEAAGYGAAANCPGL